MPQNRFVNKQFVGKIRELSDDVVISEKVAVKILDKTRLDAKTRRLLSREITSMEKMHHPNIIRLYEVVETLSKLYIVLEYASEGELHTRVTANPDGLPESDAKAAFAQIVSAVQHMVGTQPTYRSRPSEAYSKQSLLHVTHW